MTSIFISLKGYLVKHFACNFLLMMPGQRILVLQVKANNITKPCILLLHKRSHQQLFQLFLPSFMDGVTGFEVLFFIGWLGFIPYHSPPFLWFLRLESIPSNTTDMLHPLIGIFIAFTIFYIMLFLLNNNGFFFP